MIEMRLEDVVVRIAEGDPTRLVADKRIVLLKESDGERLLPFWVGPPEGDACFPPDGGDDAPSDDE